MQAEVNTVCRRLFADRRTSGLVEIRKAVRRNIQLRVDIFDTLHNRPVDAVLQGDAPTEIDADSIL